MHYLIICLEYITDGCISHRGGKQGIAHRECLKTKNTNTHIL